MKPTTKIAMMIPTTTRIVPNQTNEINGFVDTSTTRLAGAGFAVGRIGS